MDFNIKKLITLALIIGVTTLTQAQSNLVFNQALAFSLTGGSSTAVVPEGKVWKFESWTGNLRVTTSGSEYGSDVFIGSAFYNNSRAVWLPQGTTIYGQDGIPQQNFSILEFNVVAISSSSGGSGGGDSGTNSNDNGSGFGDDFNQGGVVSDTDGNDYQTVVVNGQTWTTSNLDVSSYRDGTPIPYISSYNEWRTATTGAYTYAKQNSENDGHGKIYNAWAIIGKHDNDINTPNKQLAPQGMHIPSGNEWSSLINYYTNTVLHFFENYSSSYHSGAVFPHKSQTTWTVPGNNESGLNIKGYGHIGYVSEVQFFGNYPNTDTAFWTSTITQAGTSPPTVGLYSINFSEGNLSKSVEGHTYNNSQVFVFSVGAYVRLIAN